MKNEIAVAVRGLVLHNKKILLVQRAANEVSAPNVWEFPGGKIEFGETLPQALQREIQEETGLLVEIQKLLFADTFISSSNREIVVLTYLCTCSNHNVTLSFEHQNFHWATKEEVLSTVVPPIAKQLKECDIFHNLALD